MTTVAVIIPTKDRETDLRRALAGLWGQVVLPDEVVVIDDASIPGVDADVFADAPAGVATRLVRNDPGLGANASRNRGVSAATSDYVAFLDDDDEFAPDKIAELKRAALSGAPDVIHHGAVVTYDNEDVSYPTRVNAGVTLAMLLTGNKVGGMSLACVRRGLIAELGGLDESLPALQDWDLWLRAAKSGASFRAIDRPLTTYHFVTGKAAISKSLSRLKEALALIDAKFAGDLAAMPAEARLARARTDVTRHAHRLAMNGARLAAAGAYLAGGLRTRSPKLIAAAPVALLGIRWLALLRRISG